MTRELQLSLPFEPMEKRRAAPLRRRVFRLQLEPFEDGTYVFKARSFTRRKGRVYRLRVNPHSGYVWCSCRDFHYRRERENPTFWHGPYCKHLQRAVRTVMKIEKERDQELAVAA